MYTHYYKINYQYFKQMHILNMNQTPPDTYYVVKLGKWTLKISGEVVSFHWIFRFSLYLNNTMPVRWHSKSRPTTLNSSLVPKATPVALWSIILHTHQAVGRSMSQLGDQRHAKSALYASLSKGHNDADTSYTKFLEIQASVRAEVLFTYLYIYIYSNK